MCKKKGCECVCTCMEAYAHCKNFNNYKLFRLFACGTESAHQCRRHKRRGFGPWSRKWHPTPVFLPGKFHGQRSLVGSCPWGRKESDTTEQLRKALSSKRILCGNKRSYLIGSSSVLTSRSTWGKFFSSQFQCYFFGVALPFSSPDCFASWCELSLVALIMMCDELLFAHCLVVHPKL